MRAQLLARGGRSAPDAYDGAVDTREIDEAYGARLCARVNCQDEAVATLTADYDERLMAVGPLSPVASPPALDLCAAHRDRLAPPAGWELIRHDPAR
jgi:hypothetical protein